MQSSATSDETVADNAATVALGSPADETEEFIDQSTQETLHSVSELIGRKWHPVILYHLQTADQVGFNELQQQLGGISSKVLSNSLSELQSWNTVQRRIVQEQPVRVAYSLTPAGEQLGTLLTAMEEWGREHAAACNPDE
jgi:DNA-binding HxlR family transcriptional regulator